MFKNLKKKMEDVGADLSAVALPGTLGSSQSSLRRSESKMSSMTASRESLQSIHSDSPRVIRTASISSGDASVAANNIVPLPLLIEPESDANHTQDIIDSELSVIDLTDAASTLSISDAAAPPSSPRPDPSVSIVDEPVLDNLDSSPVLLPKIVDEFSLHRSQSLSPEPLIFQDNLVKELESLRAQVKQKESDDQNWKSALANKDLECAKLKAELERYREAVSRHRANEDRVLEANKKLADVTEQLDTLKLERDSWRIAHDQAEKRSKDRDTTVQSMQRRISDLDSKLSLAKTAISDQTTEIEKYREENASVKASVGTLDKQIDKLLEDIRNERHLKEAAQVELGKNQDTAQEQIKQLNERIQMFSEQHQQELGNARQIIIEKEKQLETVRNNAADASKSQREERENNEKKLQIMLDERSQENTDLRRIISENENIISALNQKISEMEVRTKTLEEDLEGKETTLAIIRRRSAKDMESKLRERDRQIASLERQMQELSEKMAQVALVETPDETGDQYKKNVLLKFVTGSFDEALQLVRAVSVLLSLTQAEELWLREILAWKQSWLPGPKPELHSKASQNGT
ncbi:calponin homology domain-containing protein DDB_G0272472-like [Paramacrobiotus metropolitanus]|uniref:calponin homology domain-containing protein DDB_G0272472-like n=1 Tax=Paramacrobiotus metropolitanus TaxID=2943436 RepID=UPI0024458EE9|nr:calponin homology domain-containing protein DDB_G0272472-like [Paramacrobiotus metropolitanus]